MKLLHQGSILSLSLVIFAIIFAISGYVYFEKNNTGESKNYSTASTTTTSSLPVSNMSDTSAKTTSVTVKKADTFDAKCENTQTLEEGTYLKGEITVGFSTTTSLLDAKKIVSSYGLSATDPVGQYHFSLHVTVPIEQEFLWACKMKQNKAVMYAEPNRTASIGI